MKLIGEGEGGGALEGVTLQLGTVGRVTGLKLGAQGRVAEQAALVFLRVKIIAEYTALNRMAFSAADTRGGSDGENERDDDESQQHRKNRAEMVLKIFLNPGNHGEKTSDARSGGTGGKGEVGLVVGYWLALIGYFSNQPVYKMNQ